MRADRMGCRRRRPLARLPCKAPPAVPQPMAGRAGSVHSVHFGHLQPHEYRAISRLRMTTRDLEEPPPPPHRSPLVRAFRQADAAAGVPPRLAMCACAVDLTAPPAPAQVVALVGGARHGHVCGGLDGVCNWVRGVRGGGRAQAAGCRHAPLHRSRSWCVVPPRAAALPGTDAATSSRFWPSTTPTALAASSPTAAARARHKR